MAFYGGKATGVFIRTSRDRNRLIMNIGNRLKNIRLSKKVSVVELSKMIGMTSNSVVNIESNRTLNMKSIALICGALGISLPYLLISSIEQGDINEDEKNLYITKYFDCF